MRPLSGCLLLFLSGCASDVGGLDYGGQTGSLLPPGDCEIPAAESGRIRTLEGDAAFVAYAESSTGLQATVTDQDGNTADLSFEPVGNGSAQVATSVGSLNTGSYTLNYECQSGGATRNGELQLEVEPAAALPLELGTPSFNDDPLARCSASRELSFTVQLSDESFEYRQLLEIQLSVDSQAPFTIAHYGTLLTRFPEVTLYVPRCMDETDELRGACIPSRVTQLVFSTRVASETLAVNPVALTIDASCKPEPNDEGACQSAITRPARTKSAYWALLAAACATLLARRRSRVQQTNP